MPSSKTTETTPTADVSDIEWETLELGLGEQWDFDHDGPLTGHFLGTTQRNIEDKETHEIRETNVHQFAPLDAPDDIVFVWGSAQLDAAFASDFVRQGDIVRVHFLGVDQYTDKETGKPRVVKRFRIQLAKRK